MRDEATCSGLNGDSAPVPDVMRTYSKHNSLMCNSLRPLPGRGKTLVILVPATSFGPEFGTLFAGFADESLELNEFVGDKLGAAGYIGFG
jgi:hypothetical protein